MKSDKFIVNLLKKLDGIEIQREINRDRKPTREEKRAEDAARYQEMKKQYALHNEDDYLHNTLGKGKYKGEHCSPQGCVIECPFWPKVGFLFDSGNVYYDDANIDEEFYGADNALETRRKIAAMSDEEYKRYRHNLELSHELTEETEKALAEGIRLYSKSGIYPPEDDPSKIPGVQYYEWKFKGDIYHVSV